MIELTDKNFSEEVLNSELPVLVDFYATWCSPCKMLAPILEEIDKEFSDKIKLVKINIDDYTPIALDYGIQVIPTLLLFKGGKVEKKEVGYLSKNEILEKFL